MARNNQDNGKMSREEAGRMGGEATAKNHDKEFYQEIGRKGGESRDNNGGGNGGSSSGGDGKMSREEAGRKGGEARARQRE
ncbi:KGG domain-containing protein [Paenibacillus gansuensis]|uniref:KGG domain-containing protein n=1 Tax=Paenibacillus gansuensis TaxID=306542 RepID=A0ABW5PDT5_9BACL